MIAKDEESSIGQAIKTALAVVDEIVVGDTGSSDNTRLIAEGYGARVIDVPWEDDFALARNAVLSEARCDWILVLDADERLQPVRPVELQKLMADPLAAGYHVSLVNKDTPRGGDVPSQVRLFRNHPYIRYCFPVHETIEIALENWATARALTIASSPLTVLHDVGDTTRAISRVERNRRLLREATHEYPYEPYFAYCLAAETLVMLEDEALPVAGLSKTEVLLTRAWENVMSMDEAVSRDLGYGPQLAGLLSACRLAKGDAAGALLVVQQALDLFHDDLYLRYRRALAVTMQLLSAAQTASTVANAASLKKQAGCDLEDCLASAQEAVETSDKWRYLYPLRYLGLLALADGDPDAAEEKFDQALSLSSLYSHAWLGKADCACTRGAGRRAMGFYLRAVTSDDSNLSAWVRGCRTLEELGFNDNAKSWRAKAETLFPEYPGFRNDADWVNESLPGENTVLIPS